MIILQVSVFVLVGMIIFMIRNHFRKAQIHKRVADQIKEENRIWNEILKRKDINKV